MSTVLLRREIKAHWKLVLIFTIVLSIYGGMIISMFDPKLGESLKMIEQSMSQLFAAFGMSDAGTSLIEFIANYLYGFLFVVFPMIFSLILSSMVMVRYIDHGSMAYLLSTPTTRTKIAGTQAAVLLIGVFFLVGYVTVFCSICSGILFPKELDLPKFFLLNVGLLCLHIFLSGIAFFCSCVWNETRKAVGVSAGLCILFVLIQMVAQVGEKFEVLRYITPLTLFNVDGFTAGESIALWQAGILLIFGVLFYAAGIVSFRKRDLPL